MPGRINLVAPQQAGYWVRDSKDRFPDCRCARISGEGSKGSKPVQKVALFAENHRAHVSYAKSPSPDRRDAMEPLMLLNWTLLAFAGAGFGKMAQNRSVELHAVDRRCYRDRRDSEMARSDVGPPNRDDSPCVPADIRRCSACSRNGGGSGITVSSVSKGNIHSWILF